MKGFKKIKTVFIILVLSFIAPTACESFATEYSLEASLNIPTSEINGISRIEVKAGQEIVLDNGDLKINYIKINNKDTDLHKDTRTIRIIPDKNGTLEISYKGLFRYSRVSFGQNNGAARNVIDNR